MQTMVLVLHLLICVVLVGAVLMQRSEGGALGMGGGGTGGLISGRGAADMMVRITSWVGGLFFVTSLGLAVLAGTRPAERSVIDDGQSRGGIQFNIPGLPGSAAPKTAPPPPAPLSAPAPTPAAGGDAALAPAPGGAVTRAGPLAPETDAPKAAPPPRAPVGAAPAAAGAPKTTPAPATAPMIPLPGAAPTPASGAESGQPAAPSPPPTRDPTGPDE